MTERRRMFVLNNPTAPRLSPELAAEIGLNESILLLQIEFWISISNHHIEGKWWTYQSIREIQRTFTFWSVQTINRIVASLVRQGLVEVSSFNAAKYDRTRWFAMGEAGLRSLRSVTVLEAAGETGVSQNETGKAQYETPSEQTVTTIPETTTETTTDNTAAAVRARICKGFTVDLDWWGTFRDGHSDFDDSEWLTELLKFQDYWIGGRRKLKNVKLALRNWFETARRIRKERGNGKAGRPAAQTSGEDLAASIGRPLTEV